MSGYMEEYLRWRQAEKLAPQLKAELEAIADNPKEIEERFYTELEFGTAGLRGILGAGTNRMNAQVIKRATLGLSEYILGFAGGAERGVAIAYDSRRMSREFALEAALTLCAKGIHAYIYDSLRPVPMLSYMVRRLKCIAGIVITASHNPPEYNGYKVYWQDGGQAGPKQAEAIYAEIKRQDYFSGPDMTIEQAEASGLLTWLSDADDADYYRDTLSVMQRPELVKEQGDTLKMVYTPLHGSGNLPVQKILKLAGITNVSIVEQQREPNGDFPTVTAPNPEDPKAFTLAMELADKVNADAIVATDPDSDRMGLAVREKNGKFRVLTGNKIGSLLLYYILSAMKERGAIPADGFVAKSIVSTRLADAICAHFGVKLRCTPTGFRFISELIEKSHTEQGFGTFIFGFEESYGFLAGGFARDKDAVCAAMLAAEACVYYRSMGKTLSDALGEIEALCGCYNEAVKSYTLSGKEGIERIAGAMAALRSDTPREFAGVAVDRFEDMRSGKAMDYAAGKETESEVTGMNAVRFLLSDGAWICVRPSGTEPKLKLYIGANAKTDEEVEALLNKLMADTDGKLSTLLKG